MRQLDRDGVALCYEEEGEGSRPSCWRTVGAATIPTSRHSSSTSPSEATASWPWTCALPKRTARSRLPGGAARVRVQITLYRHRR